MWKVATQKKSQTGSSDYRIIQDLPVGLGNDLFERKSLSRENVVQILTSKNSNGLPRWLSGKEPACQCRRQKRRRFHSWVRKIPGVGNGNPHQYSCLENSMDKEAWWATVNGVAKSWTQLSTGMRTHTCTHTQSQFIFQDPQYRGQRSSRAHFANLNLNQPALMRILTYSDQCSTIQLQSVHLTLESMTCWPCKEIQIS